MGLTYEQCRQRLRASLHFLDAADLDRAFAAAADVPEVGDAATYAETFETEVFRVLRELHYLNTMPCSRRRH